MRKCREFLHYSYTAPTSVFLHYIFVSQRSIVLRFFAHRSCESLKNRFVHIFADMDREVALPLAGST